MASLWEDGTHYRKSSSQKKVCLENVYGEKDCREKDCREKDCREKDCREKDCREKECREKVCREKVCREKVCGEKVCGKREHDKRGCSKVNAAREPAAEGIEKETNQKEMESKKSMEIPSPTNRIFSPDSAREPGKKFRRKNGSLHRSIEKRSPFIRLLSLIGSCAVRRTDSRVHKANFARVQRTLFYGVCGGMTVEAAMVLPLCLFFLLNLGSAIEMIRLHNNLQLALWDTGGRLALYGCEQSDSRLASLLSAFYVRNRLTDFLGEDYLEGSPLRQGSGGLRLWESGMLEGDMLEIRLTYGVETPFSLGGICSFRMANRYSVHLWNGYGLPGETEAEAGVSFYVTENGEVCHRDRNCTHLRLTVREAAAGSIAEERNQWGSRYAACEKCADGQQPDVCYITPEGNCFHYRADCPGLKRTVYALTPEEAADYPLCSRCGQG